MINNEFVIRFSKRNAVLFMALILLILIEYHFCYIVPYPSFLSNLFWGRRQYILLGGIGVLWAYICFYRNSQYLKQYGKRLFAFVSIYLLCWFLQVLLSWWRYPQEIRDVISVSARFLCIAYVMPFFLLFIRENGPQKFMNSINIISLIWEVVLILQQYIYVKTGSFIFDMATFFSNSEHASVYLKIGNFRVGINAFGCLMIIYNFEKIYSKTKNKREKIFSLICFLIGIYTLIFIQQTRIYIIVVAICIVTIILIKGGKIKDQLFKISFVIAIALFILESPLVKEFVESFSLTGDKQWSTQARLYSLQYYYECIKNNPILGNGFTSDSLFYIAHGNMGQADYSDVGLFGLVAETGIFSLFFFIYPVIRMIRILYGIKKSKKKILALDIAILVFVFCTSITLVLTDVSRIICFSFIIAYFEYRKFESEQTLLCQ